MRRSNTPASLPLSQSQSTRVIKSPFMWRWAIFGLVAVLVLPLFVSSFWLHLINLSLIAIVGALGLNIVTGYSGQVSLGHAAQVGVGAFAAVVVSRATSDGSLVLSAIVAIVVGMLIGLLIGIPSLRFKGIYLAITTLAAHYALLYAFNEYQIRVINTESILMPTASIGGFDIKGRTTWYYVLLVVVFMTLIVTINLVRSRFGRRWTAVADKELAAETIGIDSRSVRLSAFVISSGIAALAGVLLAYYLKVVAVEQFSLQLAVSYLAMIVVGGLGSVLGSVLGAVFITLLPTMLGEILELLGQDASFGSLPVAIESGSIGLLIVGFLILEPGGMVALWLRIQRTFARWPLRYLPLEERKR